MVFDVGETLVDETRAWSIWADTYGIPRLTFFAVLGAAVAGGAEHRDVFEMLGLSDWRERRADVDARYGGFRPDDLYPDVLPTLSALAGAGYRIAVIGNQPASRTPELAALGVRPDVMAMSDELRVAKPDPEFYARSLALICSPRARDVAYIGDRVDNDVVASAACGLRAVWIRRGPWGYLQSDTTGAATLVVRSLDELLERHQEIWREG